MTDDSTQNSADSTQNSASLAAEYLEGWKRARADYDNLLKETSRERQGMYAMAMVKALEDYLPIYEHLSRACANLPAASDTEIKTWIDGVCHIKSQFADVLKQFGVEEITPTPGETFDPSRHEAVGEEAALDVSVGAIVRVVSVGFRRADHIIKPAQVIVAKAPT